MITTEEIAIRVYQILQQSDVASAISGSIGYKRNDCNAEDVVIVPHTIDGEGSVRYGQIRVNIYVPDIISVNAEDETVIDIDLEKLIAIRSKVIEALKSHYENGSGYNWTIGRLNPPIQEQDHNVHFVSLALELTVREKNN